MSQTYAIPSQPIASRTHTIGLLAILADWAWAGVITAAKLRAYGEPPLIVFSWTSGVMAHAWHDAIFGWAMHSAPN